MALKDTALLTGFLSALEHFSGEAFQETSLRSIEMGNTKMVFRKTFPSGNSVVVGLDKDDPDLVNDVFNAVQKVLEQDFAGRNWDIVDVDFSNLFEEKFFQTALIPALHGHGGFVDNCLLGDRCLLKTALKDRRKGKIWVILRNVYARGKSKLRGLSMF
ncbi:MAG: hypothetical protein ACTSW4_00110 [Candidatus Ranarchaeia archaeon]